jgi:hypothetical protein
LYCQIHASAGKLKEPKSSVLAKDKLVILEETPIEAHDFTLGVAQRLYGNLRGDPPVFAELEKPLAYIESHIR